MNKTSPRARPLGTIALVLASTALAILVAEFGLRLTVNPGDFLQATLVDDPILGHRIEPFSTGHDALGLRNREVPEHADIVAIGDSMTYGVSASRDSSWPQHLSRLLHEPVYNMGLGGYGPLQYLQLARTSARSMKPKLLVVGFYFGNDLMDSYYLAHGRPYWHDWRLAGGAPSGSTAFDLEGMATPHKRFAAIRNWLASHSLLYSVIRATVLTPLARREQARMAEQAGRDAWMLWKDPAIPEIETGFKPRMRLAALDLTLPAVREGMQISKRALRAIDVEARGLHAGMLTVLIPTKERAYCSYLQNSGEPLPPSFVRLCKAELAANLELKAYLDEQDMVYLDVLPVLEGRIREHQQVYPPGSDGHPQGVGYRAIAEAICAAIRERFEASLVCDPADT
jgi:lysophospholipase L1-like esterase